MHFNNGKIVYDVGDVVRIVDKRPVNCHVGWNYKMDKWLSKPVTINQANHQQEFQSYYVEENDWNWDNMMIQGLTDNEFINADNDKDLNPGIFTHYLGKFKVVS